MTREQALKRLRELPKFPPGIPLVGFLPSAVVEGRTDHLPNPTHKLYVYLMKMRSYISKYTYEGNKITVEVQVPFPIMGGGESPVAIYIELKP